MPRKCVEAECQNEGKYRISTLDDVTLYVCEEHLASWIKSGCSLAEKTSKKIKGAFMKYGIYSTLFFLGLFLTLYTMVTWTSQYGISLYSPELLFGLVLITISWIISCINLKKAYQKIKTHPSPSI